MKPKVWFVPLSNKEAPASVARKAVRVADRAGLRGIVEKEGLIGILQHIGEGQNVGYIKPQTTSAIASRIMELGGKPFFTGSSTLYRGNRSNAVDHMAHAYEHGFTPQKIGCPIIMCDGLRGADRIEVEVPDAKRCKIAYLGSAVGLMDGLVAVTHPTGHIATGFGAAIKNISMGLANRGGKLAMHYGDYPIFVAKDCTACGRCAEWCPEEAIVIKKKAELIKKKCVGCGECLTVCSFNAIDFKWASSGLALQQKVVEYCIAVKSRLGDNILYVNVIQHFQKDCDCMSTVNKAECPDIGIAASKDIVAVDTATAGLLKEANGKDIVREMWGHDYWKMLAYAEKVGLGSRDYELIEI